MEIIMAFVILFCALMVEVVLSAWVVVQYVLESKSLYTIAKRRGLPTPWMAWVPLANSWLFGCVSDQYQKQVNNRVCKRSKTLLTLKIVSLAAGTVFGWIGGVAAGVGVIGYMERSPEELAAMLLTIVGIVLILVLAIAIVNDIFVYIACYDLFASSQPEKAVRRLVLGIIFPFLLPFFIFACRNSDDGLPRKTEA